MENLRRLAWVGLWAVVAITFVRAGPFSWMAEDNFDMIMNKMTAVTKENCRSKPRQELELPKEAVSQVPVYNKLLSNVIYANRSMLLHLHNMALNRAFYYSFIYQRMNMSGDFPHQPGLMYLYMSAAADVSASPGWINASALLFDNNCTYPNWYTTVKFNDTLALFGPRAWRADDYNEPTNWLREPTNRTIDVEDYAAGRITNYTDESYKYCPYTRYEYDPTDARQEKPLFWWPDNVGYKDSLRKYSYSASIKFSNETGKFTQEEFEAIPFFGPPQPGQQDIDITLPVLFTKPYFDCGRSNRWIVSMSSPVVDYMARYSNWTHLRRPRFVAIAGMDAEFERVDINQCPISEGNPAPNLFAGTHRCRPTTMCEPISGFGFRRGGYQCVCLPGYYYPWWHDGPFQGWEIEQATAEEYEFGFDCIQAENLKVPPNVIPEFVERNKRSTVLRANRKEQMMFMMSEAPDQTPAVKLSKIVANRKRRSADGKEKDVSAVRNKRFIKRYPEETSKIRRKREAFELHSWRNLEQIRNRVRTLDKDNCRFRELYELYLPGNTGYGVNKQFEAQGRTALRLSHFLSNFLQNVDEYEQFGNLKGDRRLNETHIFGEVLASVMADFKVLGMGVYFDRYKFRVSPPVNTTDPRYSNTITREYFGPFAFRIQNEGDGLDMYRAIDTAGFQKHYVDEPWFSKVKGRWMTNFHGLRKFIDKPMIRSGPNQTSSIRFEHYPITYRAPDYEDGEWSRPTFKCDDMVMDWVLTYTVPFFGLNSIKTQIEFKGVVSIDVDMDYLDINQCPAEFYVPNAFKNSAKCDFRSQYCVPLPGKGFDIGSYKCECRQGYEYPYKDLSWFYHGQTMEEEYEKMTRGERNRYTTLKCRIAGAASVFASWGLITATTLLLLIWRQ